jgi:antitoxin component YwqK of YwqJK toxin-antitoxin module
MSVEGAYKNDFKDGLWNFYNEDGTLKKKMVYVNGKTNDKDEGLIMTKEEQEKAKKQYEQTEKKEQ